MNRFGYACINMELREKGIFNSRTMRKKTFLEKGLPYASKLVLQNVKDMLPIFNWNYKSKVEVFRISSEIAPWASEYELEDLPDYEEIAKYLKIAGDYSKVIGLRLSFHPGQFNCLASEKDYVVENCIKDLEIHGKLFDLILNKLNLIQSDIYFFFIVNIVCSHCKLPGHNYKTCPTISPEELQGKIQENKDIKILQAQYREQRIRIQRQRQIEQENNRILSYEILNPCEHELVLYWGDETRTYIQRFAYVG